MSRIAYVDGRYVPHRSAVVHVEDRGYQFADGVYEVCAVFNGRILDTEPHLDRLHRSLGELRIEPPMSRAALTSVMTEMVRRNRVRHGTIYMQVTRGVARRDHPFPAQARPVLVMTARAVDFARLTAKAATGVGVITLPDLRWRRCDIKATALLPNILAKQQAREAGAFEAWLVDDEGNVTEGSSTNAWIVTRDGALVTRSLNHRILPGVTRQGILDLAREKGLGVEERAFSVAEAKAAREAFFTSTTVFAMPVVAIDGSPVGDGVPGPVTRAMIGVYWAKVMAETGLSRTQIQGIPEDA